MRRSGKLCRSVRRQFDCSSRGSKILAIVAAVALSLGAMRTHPSPSPNFQIGISGFSALSARLAWMRCIVRRLLMTVFLNLRVVVPLMRSYEKSTDRCGAGTGRFENRVGAALGRQKAQKCEDISCRTSKVAGFSVAFCWTAGPPTAANRHNFRMLISRAGRKYSSRYSRYGVSTSSIHFMNARTRRDRLLRCATTRDTASARRRKSGMISTRAPLSKYRPIPKSGA